MTAHDSVLTALRRYFMYPDDAVDTLQAYRREVRTEVLREAAAQIEEHGNALFNRHEIDLDAWRAYRAIVDLIHPDKES